MWTRNTWVNLYSSLIGVLGSCQALTILVHGTYGLMFHPKDTAIMIKYLVQGNQCHDRNSNPHLADQKHQSLFPMPLTARPLHAIICHKYSDHYAETYVIEIHCDTHVLCSVWQAADHCVMSIYRGKCSVRINKGNPSSIKRGERQNWQKV